MLGEAQEFVSAFCLDCWIRLAALPGGHPVPQPDQPATEADARHLQVGLEGSQKIDVLFVSFFVSCYLRTVTFLEFPRPKYHSCWQDCEAIGWAELCERKKLTAGSCFQLQWLGHMQTNTNVGRVASRLPAEVIFARSLFWARVVSTFAGTAGIELWIGFVVFHGPRPF